MVKPFMVIMNAGLPHAPMRVLYDCVCEYLVIQFGVVTNTTYQKVLGGVPNGWFVSTSARGVKVVEVCIFFCFFFFASP